jgi:DNA-directed RNA polymerase specialized sigma subunit
MVSYSSGDGRNFSNYYFQMITQEIIKLLKKHKLYTEKLSL